MSNFIPQLTDFLYLVPAILIALTFHEVAHGYVSYRLGDPTPISEGRLSLNPLRHLDPIGTLMLILFRFGWAKPVMVNPGYYKKPKQGMALVALAGPLANFAMALLAIIIMTVMLKLSNGQIAPMAKAVYTFLLIFTYINIGLGIFNLIPVPPLDGSKVFAAFLSDEAYFRFTQISGVGFLVIILLIYFGALTGPLVASRDFVIGGMQKLADWMTFFI